jgi:hypothetical protein
MTIFAEFRGPRFKISIYAIRVGRLRRVFIKYEGDLNQYNMR